MKVIKSIKKFLKRPRKHHLDYIAAILGIPFMTLLIYVNVLNLQSKSKPVPSPASEKQIIIEDRNPLPAQSEKIVQVTPSENCKKFVGPINISYPQEDETVSDNPVCISIKYDDPNYCSVVWSYRINGSTWSDYNSNSVCLYNVPKGNIKFDLRVQSTASQDQTSLTRNFIYTGSGPVDVPSPTATSSSAVN